MVETNLPNSIVTGTILESVVDRVKTEIDKCAKSSDLATVATSSYVDTNKVDKKDLEYVELEESYSYLGVESPNSTEEIDGVTYTLIKRPSYIGGYSIKGRNFNSEDGTTQSEITISISDTNYLNYSDKLQVMINADIDFENIIMSSITLNALPKELLGKTIIALDNDTYTSEYLNKQYTLTFELTDTNTYTSLTSATLYGKGKIELSELPDDLIIVGGGIGFFPVLDDHPDLYIRINDLGELIINLDNRYASKSSLSDVATSGSYNDLSDTPTINTTFDGTSTNLVTNKAIYNEYLIPTGWAKRLSYVFEGYSAPSITLTIDLSGYYINNLGEYTELENFVYSQPIELSAGFCYWKNDISDPDNLPNDISIITVYDTLENATNNTNAVKYINWDELEELTNFYTPRYTQYARISMPVNEYILKSLSITFIADYIQYIENNYLLKSELPAIDSTLSNSSTNPISNSGLYKYLVNTQLIVKVNSKALGLPVSYGLPHTFDFEFSTEYLNDVNCTSGYYISGSNLKEDANWFYTDPILLTKNTYFTTWVFDTWDDVSRKSYYIYATLEDATNFRHAIKTGAMIDISYELGGIYANFEECYIRFNGRVNGDLEEDGTCIYWLAPMTLVTNTLAQVSDTYATKESIPTKTSELTNDSNFWVVGGNRGATNVYNITDVGYTGSASTIWYYPLVKMPIDNLANGTSIRIQGRLGGWISSNLGIVDVTVLNRTSTYSGTEITSYGMASGTSKVPSYSTIIAIPNSDKSITLYVKATNYYFFDFTVEVVDRTPNQSSFLLTFDSEGKPIATSDKINESDSVWDIWTSDSIIHTYSDGSMTGTISNAKADADGNTITSTYATKDEIPTDALLIKKLTQDEYDALEEYNENTFYIIIEAEEGSSDDTTEG